MFLFDFHKSESDYISFIVSFVVIIPQEKKSQDSTCISLPFISVTKPGWSCFPSPWGTIVWVIQEATHLNSITHETKDLFCIDSSAIRAKCHDPVNLWVNILTGKHTSLLILILFYRFCFRSFPYFHHLLVKKCTSIYGR